MELTLVRRTGTNDDTLGVLFKDSEYFGYTLEDEFRTRKVKGETRIPAGRYEIKLRKEGGMFQRYSKRFGPGHSMLWLQNVPGFTYVYLHIGNDEKDTEGCILIGSGYFRKDDGRYFITHSTKTYLSLHKEIVSAVEQGKQVFINVLNFDRIA